MKKRNDATEANGEDNQYHNIENKNCKATARYILQCNILCGDALTMLRNDGEPIVFAQWDFVTENKLKRRDYRLDELMKVQQEQVDMLMIANKWEWDNESQSWVPAPIKEYPPVNYWEIQNNERYQRTKLANITGTCKVLLDRISSGCFRK